MTDWVQHHPTLSMTTPDGRTVAIDVEIAPLVEQLWLLGYVTKVACQDLGEAILNGGTRTPPEERRQKAAGRIGRAWIIVRKDQGTELLATVRPLQESSRWDLHPVSKDSDPDAWISVTFPRASIGAATEELRRAHGEMPGGTLSHKQAMAGLLDEQP